MDGGAERAGGILTVAGAAAELLWVAETVAEHTNAVVLDLLGMGLHAVDLGTEKLSVGELMAVVLACPPGSAVRYHAVDKGWTPEAQLLANLGEQQAGVLQLSGRYPRPGLPVEPAEIPNPIGPDGGPRLTPMTLSEYKARRDRDQAHAAQLASTEKRLA